MYLFAEKANENVTNNNDVLCMGQNIDHYILQRNNIFEIWSRPILKPMLQCKVKRQHLLTFQVGRYCLLTLQTTIVVELNFVFTQNNGVGI